MKYASLIFLENYFNLITFPPDKNDEIKKRLEEDKFVFTIRIDEEIDRYRKGDILNTEWGDKVVVIKVIKVDKNSNIDLPDFLENVVRKYLEQFDKIAIIVLRKYKD